MNNPALFELYGNLMSMPRFVATARSLLDKGEQYNFQLNNSKNIETLSYSLTLYERLVLKSVRSFLGIDAIQIALLHRVRKFPRPYGLTLDFLHLHIYIFVFPILP